MASLISLRLDDKTRQRLKRIARRKKVSTSEVIRQAIDNLADQEERTTSAYELIADLIGVVRGGDPTRSSWSSHKITKLLKNRRTRS